MFFYFIWHDSGKLTVQSLLQTGLNNKLNWITRQISPTAFENLQGQLTSPAFHSPPFTLCIRTPVSFLSYLTLYNDTVHQLFVDFKTAYSTVKREVLYRASLIELNRESYLPLANVFSRKYVTSCYFPCVKTRFTF